MQRHRSLQDFVHGVFARAMPAEDMKAHEGTSVPLELKLLGNLATCDETIYCRDASRRRCCCDGSSGRISLRCLRSHRRRPELRPAGPSPMHDLKCFSSRHRRRRLPWSLRSIVPPRATRIRFRQQGACCGLHGGLTGLQGTGGS
eukprot:gnl/TRDRNA2_/TRDRNA2_47615_c0_seq1.p1 gnl/TRDRNA2_/TRDRNA2_47615_c0~~gnl/TRDRNA2_/TRDRNA2_47615_c0_seq1.p1  ORF type:complete len:145 (+),score=10.98 gnl/TRDRNA2_/TRDRNA2_47615_c0_seq1:29-463(+)